MPLNYSKWDQLEVSPLHHRYEWYWSCKFPFLQLSDDSDIEGHPNVDKISLIKSAYVIVFNTNLLLIWVCRWKQRDIHEKREMRKHKIQTLKAQIACNQVLLPRITEIEKTLKNPPSSITAPAYFSSLVEKLRTNPSRDCPPGNDPTKLEHTYDGMLLSLLTMVSEKSKEKLKEGHVSGEDIAQKLAKELAAEMGVHVKQLSETIDRDQKELEQEQQEQKKHITMDDLHDGFESKVSLGLFFFHAVSLTNKFL